MAQQEFDLVVIGAGPGGYVAAIRAAQLGFKVACIEKESTLGGTCLRIGCIPSKALLESSELYVETNERLAEHGIRTGKVELDLDAMLRRKDKVVATLTKGIDGLFRKHKITRVVGHGRIAGPGRVLVEKGDKPDEVRTKRILIATGSQPSSLPGIHWHSDRIGSSTEALNYAAAPEHLVVIGAGYIGLELGSVWRRLGSKVTILEYLDRILPGMDSEIAAEAQKIFEKQGLQFRLGSNVTGATFDGKQCIVDVADSKPLTCDRVLVAVGRKPNTQGLGLESLNIELDPRGRIPVDAHFATAAEGVFAIGDVIRGPMLAHKAEEEAVAAVEFMATGHGHVDYNSIPGIVYTEPEIATVGKSEDELKGESREYKKGIFPFLANGRARALNKTEGRVKMLTDARTDRVLGVHIIGPRAGDLIAEAAIAIAFGASGEDIARASHAHPTLSEALKEAALAVDQRPIHI